MHVEKHYAAVYLLCLSLPELPSPHQEHRPHLTLRLDEDGNTTLTASSCLRGGGQARHLVPHVLPIERDATSRLIAYRQTPEHPSPPHLVGPERGQ